MSVSTDGIICFGVRFDEDAEFPWDAEEYEGDEQLWWRSTQGYRKPFAVEDWNSISNEKAREYFAHRRQWEELHPIPIEIVNYCSGEYPMYILAVPGTVTRARRGSPVPLPERSDMDGAAFLSALRDAGIEAPEREPQWWLCSFWG